MGTEPPRRERRHPLDRIVTRTQKKGRYLKVAALFYRLKSAYFLVPVIAISPKAPALTEPAS